MNTEIVKLPNYRWRKIKHHSQIKLEELGKNLGIVAPGICALFLF